MPMLPLELFVFPDDLFCSQECRGPEGSARWWVLHARPRAEKELARRFLCRQHPFFLPLYKRQWRERGRLRCSHLPLFPGYIFLHGDDQARSTALETNLVVRVLAVADQPQLHADLGRVYHLMTAGLPLVPEERLQPGRLVEITGGPLAGLRGKVLRRKKQLEFLVEVDFIGRGVSV